MTNRKERLLKNLGGTFDAGPYTEPYFDGPELAESHTSIVLAERLILSVLRTEVDRLRADRTELTRFFSHFFDPTSDVATREGFIDHFMRTPPAVILGYPRTTAEFPCLCVILDSDEMTEPFLVGHYAGETLEGESVPESAEYEGAYFQQQHSVYIYAEHPDACAYLYQFAKLVLFGAWRAMENAGLLDLHFSGGELTPEDYLPENMFARAVRVQCKTMMTVPRLFAFPDKRRLRITGVFREDVVVDGVPGGVYTIPRR